MDTLSQTGSFLKGMMSTSILSPHSTSVDIDHQSQCTIRRQSQIKNGTENMINLDTYQTYNENCRRGSRNHSISTSIPRNYNNILPSKRPLVTTNSLDKFDDDSSSQGFASMSEVTKSPLGPSSRDSSLEPKLGTFSAINIILGKTVGVGIYSVSSSVYESSGSVGVSILLWIVGSLISYCGLTVYLDLGTGIPKSGGERVYLERIYKKPYKLASCMFMTYVILLGTSATNCIVFGEYMMYEFGMKPSRWNVRYVASGSITLLCLIHAYLPRFGLRIINSLSISTMIILVTIILSGIAGACMRVGTHESIHGQYLSTAQENFSNVFTGSSNQPYDYATALLKILYCYRGYSTANQVLSDVRNPTRTLRVAAPVALGLISLSYVLVNISYFLVIDSEDFRTSGLVIAGHFFRNVFGVVVGKNVLPIFLMISAFGNIAASSYSQARVNQELGREGLLPFSDWLSRKGFWDTPSSGLFIHWLVSILIIVLPPPGPIYNFLVDLSGYPVSLIFVAISLGLLYLQHSPKENWRSCYHAKAPFILIFAASNFALLIIPWIKPKHHKADSQFPYFAYPATSIAILVTGILYWVFWINQEKLIPKIDKLKTDKERKSVPLSNSSTNC